MLHIFKYSPLLCFYSGRWPWEQSSDQRTCHVTDNQRHEIRHSQVSMWGHCCRRPKGLWWDSDWPGCKRYFNLPVPLITLSLTNNCQKMLLNTESKSLLRPQKDRPRSTIRTSDAVRWNRVVGCTNPLAYMWGCVVTRPAQLQRRVLGYKRKPLKLHLLGIAVLKKASAACFGGVFWHGAKIMFPSTPCQSWHSSQTSGSGWH